MISNMTKDDIEKVRHVPLQSVLGLANYGRKKFIRCPIHNDKTASFVIFPDGSYHCFGCEANGQNAIDFLMAMGCTFTESIDELSKYVV